MFRLHEAGVDALLHERSVTQHLTKEAEKLVKAVERNAPVETGEFRGSIEALPPERTARGVEVTVHSTDFAAHIVEFGSINNPPYAPFRKAARSLGLKLRGGGERR